jgi:glycerol-3-phosphate acyltransferase PlsY
MGIENQTLQVILVIVTSYLLGSLPTAYLIGRLHKIDIFAVGSGNMGTTNVLRQFGLAWGLFVFFIDAMKGVVAILLAHSIMPEARTAATVIAAICVIIGHNWSLFVTLLTGALRGGKGAATAFGTVIMIAPFQLIAAICVAGAIVIALTRYVSLGVLVMVTIAVLWMFVLISQSAIPWEYAIYTLAVTLLILWRFRGNIQRLLSGTERRLGERT